MKQLTALYLLLVKTQLTKGRLVLIGIFAAACILMAVIIGRSGEVSLVTPTENVISFVSLFALGFMVPILSLVLASSTFGQLVEDETLVYLWLRPARRSVLALAAWLASVTVVIPATVVPAALAALIGSGEVKPMFAAAAATCLAAVAYTAVFTLVGLVLRRALLWGLLYVFIWELFVAQIGAGAARLSILTYPMSVLSRLTDVELAQADRSMAAGIIVPFAVVVVSLLLTSFTLNRTTVA